MKGSVSFIVARHPLERLVSAYRDKILNAAKDSPYQSMIQVKRGCPAMASA
jgi:hypothetical protein